MSERIDKLCDNLKTRLNAIDASVQRQGEHNGGSGEGRTGGPDEAGPSQGRARTRQNTTEG